MEELWTPWRMRYITSAKEDGCILCDLRAEEGQSDLVLRRGENGLVVMNLYPYTAGHLMVVPFRHVGSLGALEERELQEMGEMAAEADRILREELGARRIHHGINLGRPAGAGVVGHVHLHVVPRATGRDGSIPPDGLARLRTRLAPRFRGAGGSSAGEGA